MNAAERAQAKLIGEEVMRLRADNAALRERAERLAGLLGELTFPCVFCERIEPPHASACRYVAELAQG